jgi:hypothetical protein
MNVSFHPLLISSTLHFFEREAFIVEHRLVGLKQFSLPVQDKNVLRKEIYELPQLTLILPKFILGPLAILDIRARRVPPNDVSSLIE